MLLIGVLGFASDRFSTAFLPVFWLSLNNSIERLKNCYHKYLNWSKLQKRIDEVYLIKENFDISNFVAIVSQLLNVQVKNLKNFVPFVMKIF
mgnify:CR=1 FL=1